jgi:hypothetical protein
LPIKESESSVLDRIIERKDPLQLCAGHGKITGGNRDDTYTPMPESLGCHIVLIIGSAEQVWWEINP